MADFIIAFSRLAASRGVEVHLDNAVPLCIFSNEQAGELLLKGVLDLSRNSRCKPIIDIGPDLSVWPCFCLSNFDNRHLNEFVTIQEIVQYYENALRVYQDEVFPMDKCYGCDLRVRWGCQGGCTTFSVEKYRQEADAVSHSRRSLLDRKKDAIIELGDNVTIKKYGIPHETIMMKNEITGAEVELGSGFKPILFFLDGRHTLSEVSNALLARYKKNVNDRPLDIFEKGIIEDSHRKILSGFIHENFFTLQDLNS